MSGKRIIITALMLIVLAVAIYADVDYQQNIININPNPMEKSTVITVTYTDNVRADVIIETESGVLVKTLFTGNMNAGVYEFYWDRISDDGSYVPNGRYSVNVNYEVRYTSTKKTLILK